MYVAWNHDTISVMMIEEFYLWNANGRYHGIETPTTFN
jgi:hypothetical protein